MNTNKIFFDGPATEIHLDQSGKSVLAYWHELKGDRHFPRKSDFDPMRVPRALPGLLIVELGPGRDAFRYRLVGTREVDIRGRNPTGLQVTEGFIGESLEQVLGNYRHLVETEAPFTVKGVFRKSNGVWVEDVSLFLPMADNADELKFAFVYSYQRPPPSREGKKE